MTRRVIQIRVSDEHDGDMKGAARETGLSMTEFILKKCIGVSPADDPARKKKGPILDGGIVIEGSPDDA